MRFWGHRDRKIELPIQLREEIVAWYLTLREALYTMAFGQPGGSRVIHDILFFLIGILLIVFSSGWLFWVGLVFLAWGIIGTISSSSWKFLVPAGKITGHKDKNINSK
jgi:hypothetical protein